MKDELRALKNRLGLSNSGMARYLGVPKSTFLNWLSGLRQPDAAVIRLVEVMGIIEEWNPELHDLLLPPAKK